MPQYRLLPALILLVGACASWEETRGTIIDPLNRLVHADYPAALRGDDAGGGRRALRARAARVDGDGLMDLYVSGMASNSRWVLNQPGFRLPAPFPIDQLFKGYILDIMWEMFHGNRLYLNRGDGTFKEVSKATRT